MLTPYIKSHGSLQDLSGSADEDMLENTKPNLISFSLSTSSSNQTTVSAPTNSDQRDPEQEICTGGGEIIVESRETNVKKHLKSDARVTSNTTGLSDSKTSFEESMGISKLLKDISSTSPKEDIRENDTIINTTSPKYGTTRRNSLSVYSLHDANSPSTSHLSRFASHPQLNNFSETKFKKLTRAFSSFTLKNKNQTYGHVQSKVKSYIKQLKNEKVETPIPLKMFEINKTSPLAEDSFVVELQEEVKRLQRYLEERDVLLEEVLAKHHSLLLQYGDAKNRLDQIRFSSVKPPQEIKSVQTDSYEKEHKKMSTFFSDENVSSSVSCEFEPKIENHDILDSKAIPNHEEKEKLIENSVQRNQNSGNSDVEFHKSDSYLKERENNTILPQRNNTCSPDLTRLKVSSWFTSLPRQPLPVPSCYGSLGSSSNISNQQPDNCNLGVEPLRMSLSTQGHSAKNVAPTTVAGQNEWPMNDCPQIKDNNERKEVPKEMSPPKGRETYLLPIDKCNCWTPQSFQETEAEQLKLFEKCEESEVKDSSPEVLCVPPLNLECSKDSTTPFQDCSISRNQEMSEYSLSSRLCGSSCSDSSDCFERNDFKCAAKSNERKVYLDTPTSYRSIMINCQREEKPFPNRNSNQLPSSLSYNLCTDDRQSSNIQRSQTKGHKNRKSLQRPCCLEIVASQRSCCHNKCCNQAADHQVSRCENCLSRSLKKKSDSEIPSNMMQFLSNVSVCAEELRRRSEAIQTFLAHLVEDSSGDHF